MTLLLEVLPWALLLHKSETAQLKINTMRKKCPSTHTEQRKELSYAHSLTYLGGLTPSSQTRKAVQQGQNELPVQCTKTQVIVPVAKQQQQKNKKKERPKKETVVLTWSASLPAASARFLG